MKFTVKYNLQQFETMKMGDYKTATDAPAKVRRPRRPEALKYGEKTVVMSFRLPISEAARPRAIAAERGQRVNDLINELIKNLK